MSNQQSNLPKQPPHTSSNYSYHYKCKGYESSAHQRSQQTLPVTPTSSAPSSPVTMPICPSTTISRNAKSTIFQPATTRPPISISTSTINNTWPTTNVATFQTASLSSEIPTNASPPTMSRIAIFSQQFDKNVKTELQPAPSDLSTCSMALQFDQLTQQNQAIADTLTSFNSLLQSRFNIYNTRYTPRTPTCSDSNNKSNTPTTPSTASSSKPTQIKTPTNTSSIVSPPSTIRYITRPTNIT